MEKFIKHFKECYFSEVQINVPIYGVLSNSYDRYVTSKTLVKKGTRVALPPDKNRFYEEDIFELKKGMRDPKIAAVKPMPFGQDRLGFKEDENICIRLE